MIVEDIGCQECFKRRNMENSLKTSQNNSRKMLFGIFLLTLTLNVSSALHLNEETNAVSPGLKSSYEYDLPDLKHHHHHHKRHHFKHHHNKKKHFHYKNSKKRLWEEKRKDIIIPEDRIFYQTGNSLSDLPVCSQNGVCAVVDTYGAPWSENKCRCQNQNRCTGDIAHHRDGRTVVDKTKQYKMCQPVKKLPRCQRYFHDVTFTRVQYPDNSTQQVMHCRCPRHSVPYLVKRSAYTIGKDDGGGENGVGFQFSFACSPKTKIRCQRKEPCRLFSVKEEEKQIHNTSNSTNFGDSQRRRRPSSATRSDLCHCPRRTRCPAHHSDPEGVIRSQNTAYGGEHRTYTAFCV